MQVLIYSARLFADPESNSERNATNIPSAKVIKLLEEHPLRGYWTRMEKLAYGISA
jgi:hypothetical protein